MGDSRALAQVRGQKGEEVLRIVEMAMACTPDGKESGRGRRFGFCNGFRGWFRGLDGGEKVGGDRNKGPREENFGRPLRRNIMYHAEISSDGRQLVSGFQNIVRYDKKFCAR